MGRSTAAPRSRTVSRAEPAPPEPAGLELVGVGLCLVAILLLAALLSLGAVDEQAPFRNVTGPAGYAVASALARALGIGAWLFPAFGVLWGVLLLRGRIPSAWGGRALLLPVAATLLAALGALLVKDTRPPGLERYGPGGYLGVAVAVGLYGALGKGATLALLVGFLGALRVLVAVPFQPLLERLWISLGGAAPDGAAVAEADEDEEDDEEEGEEDEEEEGEGEHGDEEADDEAEDAPAARAPKAPAPVRAGPAETLPLPLPPPPPRPKKKRRVPRRQSGDYEFPPTSLLDEGENHDTEALRSEVETNGRVLAEALASFGVEATVVSNQRGPVITFYELAIASGIRLNRVTALADDLAIKLKAPSVRIVAPIPGRSTVGVEVPNLTRETVMLRDLIEENSDAADTRALPIFLGRDTAGRPLIEDLSKMPHLLIAGATGSGKSVCINSILISILYTRLPEEVDLILIDPKQVELSFFEGIPHLITPVVTDMKRAAKILEWAVDRMEDRYGLLLAGGVRNIAGYNALPKEKIEAIRERTGMSEEEAPEKLPHLVIVVDELADLMMTSGKDVELAITRLAQKSRAVGIHIILATQRPSTNVITGLIKANMPTRIAFCVTSKIDSRVILDANGAEKLLGMGDMLYMNPRVLNLRRAQGTLVSDAEVRRVVDHMKEKCPEPEYQDLLQQSRDGLGDPMEEDEMYADAVRAVLATRLGSASMLQRRMAIGYTRASRLIDMMCDHGVVGPHVGSKAREVLLTLEEWEAQQRQGDAPPSEQFEDEKIFDESWE